MLRKQKIYVVGDRVLLNGQQGTVKYIGELSRSQKIWIGVHLHCKTKHMRPNSKTNNNEKKQVQYKKTNGSIDGVIYIENKKQTIDIIFIEPEKIKKWLQGVGNKHFSR
eukprot:409446_1